VRSAVKGLPYTVPEYALQLSEIAAPAIPCNYMPYKAHALNSKTLGKSFVAGLVQSMVYEGNNDTYSPCFDTLDDQKILQNAM
jgi:hypothetical protein